MRQRRSVTVVLTCRPFGPHGSALGSGTLGCVWKVIIVTPKRGHVRVHLAKRGSREAGVPKTAMARLTVPSRGKPPMLTSRTMTNVGAASAAGTKSASATTMTETRRYMVAI